MPDITVIIPVYNREAVLERAVQSVLSQTLQDFEIILIDDGSTDGSSDLCEKLAEKDKRIRVIHQQNQGVSAARNAGVAEAKGKFIGFVDSDDCIHPMMYQSMLDSMQNKQVDLVVCGVVYTHHNRNGYISRNQLNTHIEEILIGGEQILAETVKLLTGSLMHSVCNKLYKLDSIQKNQILFPSAIPLGEDLLFNLQYLRVTESVYFIPDCFYNYISNE